MIPSGIPHKLATEVELALVVYVWTGRINCNLFWWWQAGWQIMVILQLLITINRFNVRIAGMLSICISLLSQAQNLAIKCHQKLG